MFPKLPGSILATMRRGFRAIRRSLRATGVAKSAPSLWGRFVRASYSNRSGTRAYKTYVPARSKRQPRPLVVMLHGCKQNPDDFAAGTRMNELADEIGFIVAYPEQASAANVSRCWNWFQSADQQRDGGEPSLIAGITRDVIARYNVDPRRVYVAGLSAGGAMAAIMGHAYPDLYAAIGIHSGLAYAAARDIPSALAAMRGRRPPSNPRGGASTFQAVPTIVFHGDVDTTVHPRNGEQVIAQATPVGDDLVTPAFGPQTVEIGEESGRRYTRTTQADSSGKPALEHWLVHGAGHAWSGGSVNGSFTDPRGPDATRAMLRFFLPKMAVSRP
jgi:poly(hydroxyalkanoate) depolymerase family esterase